MTAATRTNNNGKRKPYADLVCGKTLARERLKGNLKTYFEPKGFNYENYFSDRQIASLLEQVWVQSDNQGRSIRAAFGISPVEYPLIYGGIIVQAGLLIR